MPKITGYHRHEYHITNEKTGAIEREFVGYKIYISNLIAVDKEGQGYATKEFAVQERYFSQIFGGFTPADLPKLLEKEIDHMEVDLQQKNPRLAIVRYAAGVAK